MVPLADTRYKQDFLSMTNKCTPADAYTTARRRLLSLGKVDRAGNAQTELAVVAGLARALDPLTELVDFGLRGQ